MYLLLGERPFMNLFAGRPLIYSTLWKTGLYSLLESALLLCEEIIPLIHQHATLAPAWQQYLAETVWPRFWANHLFMLLSVLAYNVGPYAILGTSKRPKSRLLRKIERGDRNIYNDYIAFCRWHGRQVKSIKFRRQVEFDLFFVR